MTENEVLNWFELNWSISYQQFLKTKNENLETIFMKNYIKEYAKLIIKEKRKNQTFFGIKSRLGSIISSNCKVIEGGYLKWIDE